MVSVTCVIEERPGDMIYPAVKPPNHKQRQGAKAGIGNSWLVDLTNFVGTSSRDHLS